MLTYCFVIDLSQNRTLGYIKCCNRQNQRTTRFNYCKEEPSNYFSYQSTLQKVFFGNNRFLTFNRETQNILKLLAYAYYFWSNLEALNIQLFWIHNVFETNFASLRWNSWNRIANQLIYIHLDAEIYFSTHIISCPRLLCLVFFFKLALVKIITTTTLKHLH